MTTALRWTLYIIAALVAASTVNAFVILTGATW